MFVHLILDIYPTFIISENAQPIYLAWSQMKSDHFSFSVLDIRFYIFFFVNLRKI